MGQAIQAKEFRLHPEAKGEDNFREREWLYHLIVLFLFTI